MNTSYIFTKRVDDICRQTSIMINWNSTATAVNDGLLVCHHFFLTSMRTAKIGAKHWGKTHKMLNGMQLEISVLLYFENLHFCLLCSLQLKTISKFIFSQLFY
jgi:galactitol-specific phosphotransferase system IIB component